MSVFSEENEATFLEGMHFVRELVYDTPSEREKVLEGVATEIAGNLELPQVVTLAAFAVLRLAEEEAALAKTLDNFDIFADARAERYRLAWTSARQRAMNHLLALVDADDERDGLRQALDEAHSENGRLTGALDATKAELGRVIEARERDVALAKAIAEDAIGDAIEERDEARAEVVRLGRENEQLRQRIEDIRQAGIEASEREP